MKDIIEKEIPGAGGISYEAWSKTVLKKTPVTKKHLKTPVWIAGKPKTSTQDILIKIKQPGDYWFPEGGFIIREKGLDYNTNHFPDAVRAFPGKKRRGRKTQLSIKLEKTKTSPEPAIPFEAIEKARKEALKPANSKKNTDKISTRVKKSISSSVSRKKPKRKKRASKK